MIEFYIMRPNVKVYILSLFVPLCVVVFCFVVCQKYSGSMSDLSLVLCCFGGWKNIKPKNKIIKSRRSISRILTSLHSSVWQWNLQWSQTAFRMSWAELQWELLVFRKLLTWSSRKLLLGGLQLETMWRRETLRFFTTTFLQRLELARWRVITVSRSVQEHHTVTTTSSWLIVLFLQWFLLVAKDVEDIYEDIQPVNEQRSNGWSSNEFESFDDLSDDDTVPPACGNHEVSQWRSAVASAELWRTIKGCFLVQSPQAGHLSDPSELEYLCLNLESSLY